MIVRLHVLLLPVPGGELEGAEEARVLLLSVPDGELSDGVRGGGDPLKIG